MRGRDLENFCCQNFELFHRRLSIRKLDTKRRVFLVVYASQSGSSIRNAVYSVKHIHYVWKSVFPWVVEIFDGIPSPKKFPEIFVEIFKGASVETSFVL